MTGSQEPQARADRRRVIYEGRVQGVGFRYTTLSIAKLYEVNGYVKNIPDGTVELVAEGPSAEVDRFLQHVAQEFRGYIERQTAEPLTPGSPLHGFEIRR